MPIGRAARWKSGASPPEHWYSNTVYGNQCLFVMKYYGFFFPFQKRVYDPRGRKRHSRTTAVKYLVIGRACSRTGISEKQQCDSATVFILYYVVGVRKIIIIIIILCNNTTFALCNPRNTRTEVPANPDRRAVIIVFKDFHTAAWAIYQLLWWHTVGSNKHNTYIIRPGTTDLVPRGRTKTTVYNL